MFGRFKVLSIAAAVVTLSLVGSASADTLKFVFKTPEDAKGWSAVTQKWKVGSKGYRPKINEAAYPAAVLDKPGFDNVEASTSVRVPGAAGIFVRAKINNDAVSGYMAFVTRVSETTGTLFLYKLVKFALNGSGGEGVELCQGDITIGPKVTITIQATGSRLRTFNNGTFVCAAPDTSYKSGRVGLFSEYTTDPALISSFQSVTIDTP